MAISEATTGFGSELYIDIGAGLVKVAEITDIPELPTGSERELYETSNYDTVEYKEYKKHPLKDGVAVTITGNYVINSTADGILQTADDSEDPLPYRIVLPEGDTDYHVEGEGLFYGLKRMNPGTATRQFEITLKPTTAPDTTEAGA